MVDLSDRNVSHRSRCARLGVATPARATRLARGQGQHRAPRPRPRVAAFGAGTFAVAAHHAGHDGFYPLLMPTTTEQAVIGGRDTFRETKKVDDISLDIDGDSVTGSVARMGVTIIELTGTVSCTTNAAINSSLEPKYRYTDDRWSPRRRPRSRDAAPRRALPDDRLGRIDQAAPYQVVVRPSGRAFHSGTAVMIRPLSTVRRRTLVNCAR